MVHPAELQLNKHKSSDTEAHFLGFYISICNSIVSTKYEVCPKSLWTSLSIVLDKHIGLKAYKFHKVQHHLNKCSKFHENS